MKHATGEVHMSQNQPMRDAMYVRKRTNLFELKDRLSHSHGCAMKCVLQPRKFFPMFFSNKNERFKVASLQAEIAKLKAQLLAYSLYDERDYLEANPDVRKAVADGAYKDGLAHFRSAGLQEGRFPGCGGFEWYTYLHLNGDLAHFRNERDPEAAARKHFREAGYKEGRAFKAT